MGGRRGDVELHQFLQRRPQRRRRVDPAQPPPRHRPALGETVDDDHRIVGVGDLQEGRRQRAVMDDTGIYFVGDDPQAPGAAELEHRALFLRLHHPACRVARRIDADGAGAPVAGVEQTVEIEAPAAVAGGQCDFPHFSPHDLDAAEEVGPHRRDADQIVAGVDQGFGDDHQRVHAGRGNGDAVGRDGAAVKTGGVFGDGPAEFRHAGIGRVEGMAGAQRAVGRRDDEFRGRQVRLAEPEADRPRGLHPLMGYLADRRRGERRDARADPRAGARFRHRSHITAPTCHGTNSSSP